MSGDQGGLGVILPFGGQERTFRLEIGNWREIEARCNAGPEELAARLAPTVTAIDNGLGVVGASTLGLTGRWRIDDIREVLYQGLRGGGASAVEATKLVATNFDAKHMRESAAIAFAIIMSSLEGLPSSKAPKPGEPQGEAEAPAFPTDASSGVTSTPVAAAPDSGPETSIA